MKKLLALFLALALMIPAFASAQTIAEIMAQYTDTEIQMLAEMYAAELLRRAGNGFTLEPGFYTVGIDIPAMVYRIEFAGASQYSIATIDFYPDYQNMDDSDAFYSATLSLDSPAIGKIGLAEGNVVAISVDCVRFVPFTGVGAE